ADAAERVRRRPGRGGELHAVGVEARGGGRALAPREPPRRSPHLVAADVRGGAADGLQGEPAPARRGVLRRTGAVKITLSWPIVVEDGARLNLDGVLMGRGGSLYEVYAPAWWRLDRLLAWWLAPAWQKAELEFVLTDAKGRPRHVRARMRLDRRG